MSGLDERIEKIARIIDPYAFKRWDSAFAYNAGNDSENERRDFAEWSAGAAIKSAKEKAAVILSALPSDGRENREKLLDDMEDVFRMDCGPGVSLRSLIRRGMAAYHKEDDLALQRSVEWIMRQVCKNVLTIIEARHQAGDSGKTCPSEKDPGGAWAAEGGKYAKGIRP